MVGRYPQEGTDTTLLLTSVFKNGKQLFINKDDYDKSGHFIGGERDIDVQNGDLETFKVEHYDNQKRIFSDYSNTRRNIGGTQINVSGDSHKYDKHGNLTRSVAVKYDKNGNEISREIKEAPSWTNLWGLLEPQK